MAVADGGQCCQCRPCFSYTFVIDYITTCYGIKKAVKIVSFCKVNFFYLWQNLLEMKKLNKAEKLAAISRLVKSQKAANVVNNLLTATLAKSGFNPCDYSPVLW